MRGESIVCFAKDRREDPTSNNHVLEMLSRDNRVLWLDSIATRTPDLTRTRDVGKILAKVKSFARGPLAAPREAGSTMHVHTPLVLPFPHSDAATRVNGEILRMTVGALRSKLGMRPDFQLWTFLPTAAPYVRKLGASLVVYYCVDEWSGFSYVDGPKIAARERELCEQADIVFTTSRTLLRRKRAFNPETHLSPHGVDVEHFGKALSADTEVPAEIRDLKGPVVGFVGLLEDWVDLEAIVFLAARRPTWSFVVIGKAMSDVSRFARPNIHFLGRKPYAQLPAYLKKLDVGLINFRVNDLTRNMNPLKLREYLSAGLPVVSSDLPEVEPYADGVFGDVPGARGCGIYRSYDELVALCDRALAEDSPAARQRRHEGMRDETWERKVAAIGAHIARVREEKARGRRPS